MADKPKNEKPVGVDSKKEENVKYTDKDPAKSIPKIYKSTADIAISKNLVGQIMGQDKAVQIIKKAAEQRRNVLLIGEPGTGKSMLGLALAQLLPKEKLVDIVSFPNPNDENTPLVRTVPAGQGRDLVARARIQGMSVFKNQNAIFFILVLVAILAPWWSWAFYIKHGAVVAAIMTGASLVVSILFVVGVLLTTSIGRRMEGHIRAPKLIVDNFNKKQVPFNDATGAHAGALLGDVLHDPFQCFIHLYTKKYTKGRVENVNLNIEIDTLFQKYPNRMQKNENNYEAIHLPKNELLIQGETNGSISPVEVLSCNRHDYDGNMIKLTTSKNKELIVTPEHKIAVWKNNKIAYIEAKDIKEKEEIVSKAEDIIIDEQDIINTYPQEQQELAKSYYRYLELREQNPSWGYKRIATKLGVSYGRTRWWWEKKSAPVPIQTTNWLKARGLLPLKIDNPQLPFIAKVLGATFGDGGIFENLNGVFLSSSEKEAVEEFGGDIEKIFDLKENENSRIIEGGVYGHSWCYQNTNRNIIRFFLALGAPKGNKTNIELKIPNWVSLNENLEDEFYGSFFGGELGSPSLHKDQNRLTTLEIGITGSPKFDNNRKEFLHDIEYYLLRKNVLCNQLYQRKLNENSIIYRLQLAKNIDNIILFLMNIKINYCRYKVDRLYKSLGQWAMLKKQKYYKLIEKGVGAESVMKLLKLTPNSLYLLLNHFGSKQEASA